MFGKLWKYVLLIVTWPLNDCNQIMECYKLIFKPDNIWRSIYLSFLPGFHRITVVSSS